MKWMVIGLALVTFPCLASVQSVVSQYRNKFMQEEKQLLGDLAATRGLSEQAWEQFKKEQYPLYLQSEAKKRENLKAKYPQPVGATIQSYFDHALRAACMKNIEIISINGGTTDMYALTKAVCVNEGIVNETHADNNEIIATFLHELGHIQYQDDFIKYCLNKLSQYSVIDIQEWSDLLQKWQHLREKRADLIAILAGYIDGRISFFACNNFPESDSHPSAQDHTDYLQGLKSQL